MTVARENRKVAKKVRKNLALVAKATDGNVEERSGSGGKIISRYYWETAEGNHEFIVVWHNSVSDRHFAKKLIGDVKRKLAEVPGLNVTHQKGHRSPSVRPESDPETVIRFKLSIPPEVHLIFSFRGYLNAMERSLDFDSKVIWLGRILIRWESERVFQKEFDRFRKSLNPNLT